MDLATIVGLVLAAGCLLFAAFSSGASPSSFVDVSALVVVVGGTIGAVLIAQPLRSLKAWRETLAPAFRPRPTDVQALARRIVRLAEVARREGLLSIDRRLRSDDHPSLILGMQMAVDGIAAETIEDVLRADIETAARRQAGNRGLWEQIGRLTPAFGMIGTLLGLIIMLGDMTDPTTIGPGMAVALLTTLYGTVVANCLALPLADKLAGVHRQELLARELILRGVLAIHNGDHPRVIEKRLGVFLPRSTVEPERPRLAA